MSQRRRKVVLPPRGEKSMIQRRKRNPTAPPAGSRQHLRTAATRKALLAAAFKVFVRDGFEASRIEDIAAEAGRSRGAFYVNFCDKAEAFLALREQQLLTFHARIRNHLQGQATREEQRQAVEDLFVELVLEKSYLLLELEFKLFSIRHPRLLKRVAKKHIGAKHEMEELRDILPKGDTFRVQQRTLSFEAILEGFALNFAFDSEVMTREYLKSCVPHLARTVMG